MENLQKKIIDSICEVLGSRKKLLEAREQARIADNNVKSLNFQIEESLDRLRNLIPDEKAEFIVYSGKDLIKVKKDNKEYHFKILVEYVPSLQLYLQEQENDNSKI